MRQTIAWLLLTILMTGCSALDVAKSAASLAGPDPALEVDANVGQAKTEGDDSVAQNANTAVSLAGGSTEENYGPVGQVVNESGLEYYELLLVVLLAGWAIPSPAEMMVGTARTLRQTWKTLLP